MPQQTSEVRVEGWGGLISYRYNERPLIHRTSKCETRLYMLCTNDGWLFTIIRVCDTTMQLRSTRIYTQPIVVYFPQLWAAQNNKHSLLATYREKLSSSTSHFKST